MWNRSDSNQPMDFSDPTLSALKKKCTITRIHKVTFKNRPLRDEIPGKREVVDESIWNKNRKTKKKKVKKNYIH